MKNKNLSGGLFAAGKPQPLTVCEQTLSAQIAEWLDNRRIYNDRLNCGKIQTTAGSWLQLCKTGTPDRFAVLKGQIVFIEVKRRGMRPSDEQLARHTLLREAGAIVLVVDSFDRFELEMATVRAAIETATMEIIL